MHIFIYIYVNCQIITLLALYLPRTKFDTNNPTHHRRLPLCPLRCLGFPGGERPAALRQKRGGGLRATGGAWGDNDDATECCGWDFRFCQRIINQMKCRNAMLFFYFLCDPNPIVKVFFFVCVCVCYVFLHDVNDRYSNVCN